jgi:hypothetical protein
MVTFFILVVPLGGVSIFFIIIQPIMIGTYCTLCLIAALAMLIMIPLTLDEVVAMANTCCAVSVLDVRSGARRCQDRNFEMICMYGRSNASSSATRGRSRMRELRTYGSGRGALSNGRPYRDKRKFGQRVRWPRVHNVCTERSI